jgi:uncharacterized membrane protein YgcG
MAKRPVLTATTWLAGPILAAAGVAAALILLGHNIFGPSVHLLSQATVRKDLAVNRSAASASAAPAPARSRSSSPPAAPGASGSHTYAGGTVYASCSAGQVRLTQWTPALGYGADGMSPGPAAKAWVRFISSTKEEVVTASCSGDHPKFTSALDDSTATTSGGTGGAGGGGAGAGDGDGDHGGGGRGRGGGSGGSSGGGGGKDG